jgi:hypothetical protein
MTRTEWKENSALELRCGRAGSRIGKILVKGVNEGDSAQVLVPMGNIKFEKCPLYP